MTHRQLLNIAIEAMTTAYAPYSKVRVGAALLTVDDEVFTGVNVENVSFGATNCAERTAVFKAVSEGQRKFKAIAIASNLDDIITPCGICRQVLVEFCDDDFAVVLGDKERLNVYRLADLLPAGFKPEALDEVNHEL